MNVEAIRHALREEDSPSLRRRRRIGLLAALGLVDLAVISLYQIGVIRHVRLTREGSGGLFCNPIHAASPSPSSPNSRIPFSYSAKYHHGGDTSSASLFASLLEDQAGVSKPRWTDPLRRIER